MESLARILLPILRDYLESDEERKDYEELGSVKALGLLTKAQKDPIL